MFRPCFVVSASLVVTLVGCGADVVTPGAESIRGIHADLGPLSKTAVLEPGVAVGVRAYPVSASGTQIDTVVPISFVSRHPESVTVDQHGVATAVAVGASFVIASLSSDGRAYMDSVNIAVVTFPPSASP